MRPSQAHGFLRSTKKESTPMKQPSLFVAAVAMALLSVVGTACHRQPSPPVIIVAPQMTNTPEAKNAPAQPSLEAKQP
jgi:hypothetical protein